MALIPRSLEDFINNNKFLITNNPLFNLAVANMRISRALQRALNNQAKAVSAIADQINRVSDLSSIVQSYTQNKTNADTKTTFGKNKEDAKQILDRLLAVGVDKKFLQTLYDEYNDKTKPNVQISDNQITLINGQLSTKTESLNTQTSKENLTLQTLTNRYTQSGEQASSVLAKDGQSKSTIIAGYKGIS
jgi:hypothetical protein